MAYTLGGVTLPNIQREFIKKTTGVIEIPIIDADSDQVEAAQMTGTVREVQLEGIVIEATGGLVDIRAFIAQLEGWTDGAQTAVLVYASDLLASNINVVVKSCDWEWVLGTDTKLVYSLTLMEAASVF